jgi:hypothetical protein
MENKQVKIFFWCSATLFFLLINNVGFSQFIRKNVKDSIVDVHQISPGFTIQIPRHDLAKRFGWNSSIGGEYAYKTRKNWIFGAEGNFIFGNVVKETEFMDFVRTEDDLIISSTGNFALIALFQRGFNVSGNVYKIIPIFSPNDNSGLVLGVGFGYIQHRIRIDVQHDNVPSFHEELKRGYDRMASGMMIKEFIGYQYYGNKRLTNFRVGFEFIQGLTQSRREIYFDTMLPPEDAGTTRRDYLVGLKFSWNILLYKRSIKSEYY